MCRNSMVCLANCITQIEGEEAGQGEVQNPDHSINALLTCFQEQGECN